jgi:hypothetical protein
LAAAVAVRPGGWQTAAVLARMVRVSPVAAAAAAAAAAVGVVACG